MVEWRLQEHIKRCPHHPNCGYSGDPVDNLASDLLSLNLEQDNHPLNPENPDLLVLGSAREVLFPTHKAVSQNELEDEERYKTSLVKTFVNRTAVNSQCVQLMVDLIKSAKYSLRVALYCLGNQEVKLALCQAAKDLEHRGRVVLVLDDNQNNQAALAELQPIFQRYGSLIKLWYTPVCTTPSLLTTIRKRSRSTRSGWTRSACSSTQSAACSCRRPTSSRTRWLSSSIVSLGVAH